VAEVDQLQLVPWYHGMVCAGRCGVATHRGMLGPSAPVLVGVALSGRHGVATVAIAMPVSVERPSLLLAGPDQVSPVPLQHLCACARLHE
jgi:hypothetical protein